MKERYNDVILQFSILKAKLSSYNPFSFLFKIMKKYSNKNLHLTNLIKRSIWLKSFCFYHQNFIQSHFFRNDQKLWKRFSIYFKEGQRRNMSKNAFPVNHTSSLWERVKYRLYPRLRTSPREKRALSLNIKYSGFRQG